MQLLRLKMSLTYILNVKFDENIYSCIHCRQGWEFALSLKIAHFKERPWAICSRRSLQKSDVSGFATDVSKSLSKYEWFARKIRIFRMFLTVFPLINAQERIAHMDLCSHRSLLMSIFTHSPFFKERRERFWDLCNLLRSLIKKERMWAIRSCTSVKRVKVRLAQKKQANRTYALSLTKNKQFSISRKTDERITNPDC